MVNIQYTIKQLDSNNFAVKVCKSEWQIFTLEDLKKAFVVFENFIECQVDFMKIAKKLLREINKKRVNPRDLELDENLKVVKQKQRNEE